MNKTLYDKVFDRHVVRRLGGDQYQLFIGLHLIHEATSPQAFSMMRERKLEVLFPDRNFATADHIIPTNTRLRPFEDPMAEDMLNALEKNVGDFKINYFSPSEKKNGIVHVIGPEYGITQPGMTIACGDSHTSTHGAFGALAFGVGASQVRDILASQTLIMGKLKVRRIEINGRLKTGVTAKDIILYIINLLGSKGGVGYAYEFGGSTVEKLSMDQRMTICNMSVEGGARCGYINPDETTYDYLKGRRFAPTNERWQEAVAYWESIKSDPGATYDDVVKIDAEKIEPMVTWGIHLGQSIPISGKIPRKAEFNGADRQVFEEACEYMGFSEGQQIVGTPIDVAFIGSCTNGRISDFVEVAEYLKEKGRKVSPKVKALAVPGSQAVRDELVKRGIDQIFRDAGFEFREAGCSMCLAMNTDKLVGREMCASSSNRNFKGRQGSPTGRTLIMSPISVAAAALEGKVVDYRNA